MDADADADSNSDVAHGSPFSLDMKPVLKTARVFAFVGKPGYFRPDFCQYKIT